MMNRNNFLSQQSCNGPILLTFVLSERTPSRLGARLSFQNEKAKNERTFEFIDEAKVHTILFTDWHLLAQLYLPIYKIYLIRHKKRHLNQKALTHANKDMCKEMDSKHQALLYLTALLNRVFEMIDEI